MGRWFGVIVLVACIVGLLIWARGSEHHHGQYVGSLGSDHAVVVVAWGTHEESSP